MGGSVQVGMRCVCVCVGVSQTAARCVGDDASAS